MKVIRPAVHHQLFLDVEIGRLPDLIGAPIVDQELELVFLLLLARRLQAAPLRLHEGRLAVLGAEFAIRIQTLGADDLAVLEGGGRLLEAVGAHRPQTVIGDVLAALGVLVVAVHEGVFFGLPVEALELVGIFGVAHVAQHALHVIGDARGDQAVRHGLAGRVHIALGKAHAPLAIHRGEVHLARCRRGQPDMARLADLGRHDVDIDREQAALS